MFWPNGLVILSGLPHSSAVCIYYFDFQNFWFPDFWVERFFFESSQFMWLLFFFCSSAKFKSSSLTADLFCVLLRFPEKHPPIASSNSIAKRHRSIVSSSRIVHSKHHGIATFLCNPLQCPKFFSSFPTWTNLFLNDHRLLISFFEHDLRFASSASSASPRPKPIFTVYPERTAAQKSATKLHLSFVSVLYQFAAYRRLRVCKSSTS